MKSILLTIFVQLFAISLFAQEKELKEFSTANLELTISDVKKTADALEIEITLKNKGLQNILTVLPKTDDSFKTSYFLGFDEKSKVLQIRKHLFLYPIYVLDAPDPCYTLVIVKAGESYRERVTLGYPKAINSYLGGMSVDISKYEKLNALIGVLPFDNSIYQIPNSRPFGHCVMSQDKITDGIYTGKTLIELQKVLSTGVK